MLSDLTPRRHPATARHVPELLAQSLGFFVCQVPRGPCPSGLTEGSEIPYSRPGKAGGPGRATPPPFP